MSLQTNSKAGTTIPPRDTATRESTNRTSDGPESKSTLVAPRKKKFRGGSRSTDPVLQNALEIQFTNLPVELFLEIAKYIHPTDLINLSRANKVFRSMFMQRRATEIWRIALANTGLPPCPDDSMSEPAYAALMFIQRCSKCFKPATRHVDPVFLVRPCGKCRKDMAMSVEMVGEIQNLLPKSRFLVPTRGKLNRYWYMKEHYEEVQQTLDKLFEAGNGGALHLWLRQRVNFVQAWHERADPLIKWVENQENDYKEGLENMKQARIAEVETRLLELGWELIDIQKAGNNCAKWKSLVHKTKPLDTQEWEDILPCLLDELVSARTIRLRAERRGRTLARKQTIENWIRSLPDTRITLRWKDLASNSSNISESFRPKATKKRDVTLRIKPGSPSCYTDISLSLPLLEDLLGKDRSMEEFQLEFQSKQNCLKEQKLGRQLSLEAALAKMLPEDLKPVEIHGADFDLLAFIDGENVTCMHDRLSVDLRRLLRADVVFYDASHEKYSPYYSLGINDLTDCSRITYSEEASNIAEALLREFQSPDISRLELPALGRSFLCGRCTGDPVYYTWCNLIVHYVTEIKHWREMGSPLVSHDIGKLDHENPLVRFAMTGE